jgi:hypothetical protein
MSHTTCTWGNRGDSWLLMVGSQTTNLTLNPSFGHNLCFKCLNGSCKPILDIYASIDLQWYKELFNPMGFDLYNRPLKIWESIGTPIPKMKVHLGVWGFIPSHSFAFLGTQDVILGLPSWPATLQALALVMSPKLGLWHLLNWFILLCTLEITHFHDSCNNGFPFNHNWFFLMQFDVIAHGILIGIVIHMLSYLEVVVPMNVIFFYYEWCYGLLLQCMILLLNVLHWLVILVMITIDTLCYVDLVVKFKTT